LSSAFAFRFKEHHKPHLDEQGNTDGQRECSDLLNKVHNSLQRDVEFSFQTVMAAMAGFPERYCSHIYHSLIMAPFLRMITESDLNQSDQQSVMSDSSTGDSFLISEANGQTTLSNQRMDYTLRPDGLDGCSLYDFVGYWDKHPLGSPRIYTDWTEGDPERSPDSDFDIMRPPKPQQYLFHPNHNQHKTHGITFRTDHERHIVVLKGPNFPSRDKDPVRFAQMILLLFKPFRSINDLRGADSWTTALLQFEYHASARIKFYIQNIEELRVRQIAWEEDVVLKSKNDNAKDDADDEPDSDNDDRNQCDERGTPPADESDSEDDSDSNANAQNTLAWTSSGKNAEKLTEAYQVAQNKHLFVANASDCVTAYNPKDGQDTRTDAMGSAWLRQMNRSETACVHNWNTELNLLRSINRSVMTGTQPQSPMQVFQPQMPRQPRPAMLLYNSGEETAHQIADRFTLNPKQYQIFMLVSNTLDAELHNDTLLQTEQRISVQQLKMYVGGPGGTGKSRIVDAIKYLFKQRGKSSWVQCAAPTGTAAKAIQGRTFFSMLGIDPLMPNQTSQRKPQATKRDQYAAELKHLRFLIIDEVSMVPCDRLQQISSQLVAIRASNTECDFGGLHVLFFGDFYQLTPIKGKPLYSASAEAADWDGTIQGRKLWKRVNKVFFLTQQHRQAGDKQFGELLQRIRHGNIKCCCDTNREMTEKCAHDKICDYHLLNSRVLTTDIASKLRTDPEWNQCKIVVPQNLIRQAWNIDAAVAFAMQAKQPLLICTAIDRKGKKPVSRGVQKRLGLLKDSVTASLPYRLPLVVGLRVMLRRNIGTELGLTNGSEGTIKEVILDPAEAIPQALIEEAALGDHPVIYNLQYHPKRVIVEFDSLDMPKPFTGMKSPNQVPIQTLGLSYRWTHPTKAGAAVAKPWSICRHQFPLIPTRAFTIHMAQSRTFDKLVADIRKDITTSRATANALYVALSRGQYFEDLHILQSFHHSVLHCKPDRVLLAEMDRLELIEKQTLKDCTAHVSREVASRGKIKLPFHFSQYAFLFSRQPIDRRWL